MNSDGDIATHNMIMGAQMHPKLKIATILAGLALLFLVQNVAMMEVQLLFWSLQMPRALFMFLLLAVGIALGWVLHSYYRHRRG